MAKLSSWHVATAAEAIAAAQFARFGYDVSVQYGANQPEYDLIVARGGHMLKVSVKGSQDGSWGLTQTQLSRLGRADYHAAADAWLQRHKSGTALCFVQFKGVIDDALPRLYLAWPSEVVARLKATANNRGDTILYEDHRWTDRARGAGTRDRLPDEWRMTRARAEQLVFDYRTAVPTAASAF